MNFLALVLPPTRRLSMLVAAVLLGMTCATAFAKGGRAVVDGEVLVKLNSTTALGPLLRNYPLTVLGQFGTRPIYRLALAASADPEATIEALSADPSVQIAEPNYLHDAPEARKNVVWAIGSAQVFAAQWAPQAMRLPEAHRVTTGAGVRIAVLDTGVDAKHPLLAGRLLPGFDFVDGDRDPAEGRASGAAFGHGTHVAGLIAMVAPSARIMPLRVLDADGQTNEWILLEALLYAIDPDGDPETDDGAHVVNLSLGTISRTRLFDTVSQLATCSVPDAVTAAVDMTDPGYDDDDRRCSRTSGALIIAAAGNDGSTTREYPAAENTHGLLAVGASTAARRLAPFSNFGSWVSMSAPGDRVTSSVPGGRYGTWSGTSMAAPLVSGTAALVRSLDFASSAEDIARRIVARAMVMCNTDLRDVDAAAAVLDRSLPDPSCR